MVGLLQQHEPLLLGEAGEVPPVEGDQREPAASRAPVPRSAHLWSSPTVTKLT
jgi:hypothetical protein